jgi:hypothetical protein
MINKQDSSLSVIVFSKDRPLQLQGYLESLIYFSNIDPSDISVLYKDSEAISYSKLVESFPGICWLMETNFYQDTFNLIRGSKDFVMFGVDDVVFKEHIDFPAAIDTLKLKPELFGFSLRLGENIKPLPKDIETFESHLEWNWKTSTEAHWNYPWELIATIYRSKEVIDIVSAFDPLITKNPNFFEAEVALNKSKYISNKNLGCFKRGKCVVITVNRVQDDFLNGYDGTLDTDIESLYALFQKGSKIDFKAIAKMKHHDVHVGGEFFRLEGESISYRSAIKIYLKIFQKKILNILRRVIKKNLCIIQF